MRKHTDIWFPMALVMIMATAVGIAQEHDQAPPLNLHYQCAIPGVGGQITWEDCGSPVATPKAPSVTAPVAPPPPLAAIAVSKCGLAVSLFIQLDANHLLHADPRQSEMFTNVNGKSVSSIAAPMPWKEAYDLAKNAVLTSHVYLPCDERDQAT